MYLVIARLKYVRTILAKDLHPSELEHLTHAIAEVEMLESGKKVLKCDMYEECLQPVTHIDANGFGYCHNHGVSRRHYKPCRKLRPWELRRLQRGEPLKRY